MTEQTSKPEPTLFSLVSKDTAIAAAAISVWAAAAAHTEMAAAAMAVSLDTRENRVGSGLLVCSVTTKASYKWIAKKNAKV